MGRRVVVVEDEELVVDPRVAAVVLDALIPALE